MTAEFKAPWESIDDYPAGNGDAMVQEARKELCVGHPLAFKSLKTLARRGDCDDVLFEVSNGPKVAVVHLTWSSSRERHGYPDTQVFDSLDEFLTTRMEQDRIEFGED